MDFMTALDVSASALSAERTHMNIISMNLANAKTTRTAEGVTALVGLLAPLTNAERSVLLRILGEDVSLHSSSKTISNQQTGILRKLDLPGRRELTHIFKAYGFQKAENSPVSF